MDSPPSLASELRSMSFEDIFLLTTMAVFAVSFIGPETYFRIDDGTVAWGLTLLGMAWAFSRGRVAYSPTAVSERNTARTRVPSKQTRGFAVTAVGNRPKTDNDDDTRNSKWRSASRSGRSTGVRTRTAGAVCRPNRIPNSNQARTREKTAIAR